MSDKDTGESAFPVIKNDSYGNPVAQHMGLTVRDYFAAKAMQALVAKDGGTYETDAANAFMMADEMIAERAK